MLTPHHIHDSIRPLRYVFWGGLFLVFDLYVSTNEVRFDFINDTLGSILIAIGVVRLAETPVDDIYQRRMKFVTWIAVLSVFESFSEFLVFKPPLAYQVAASLFGTCQFVAILFFALAMERFAESAKLYDVSESWHFTYSLFLFIYGPLIVISAIVGLASASSTSRQHYDIGAAVCLVVPVLVIPIIHLFVSTSRMRRAIDRSGNSKDPNVSVVKNTITVSIA